MGKIETNLSVKRTAGLNWLYKRSIRRFVACHRQKLYGRAEKTVNQINRAADLKALFYLNKLLEGPLNITFLGKESQGKRLDAIMGYAALVRLCPVFLKDQLVLIDRDRGREELIKAEYRSEETGPNNIAIYNHLRREAYRQSSAPCQEKALVPYLPTIDITPVEPDALTLFNHLPLTEAKTANEIFSNYIRWRKDLSESLKRSKFRILPFSFPTLYQGLKFFVIPLIMHGCVPFPIWIPGLLGVIGFFTSLKIPLARFIKLNDLDNVFQKAVKQLYEREELSLEQIAALLHDSGDPFAEVIALKAISEANPNDYIKLKEYLDEPVKLLPAPNSLMREGEE
jgi:hypothetical protein